MKKSNSRANVKKYSKAKKEEKVLLLDRLREYKDDVLYVQSVMEFVSNNQDNLYIFGAGDRAQWIGKILREKNLNFCGYLVDKKYYSPDMKANMYGGDKEVYCFEDVLKSDKKINILLGISECMLDNSKFAHSNINKVMSINLGNRNDYLCRYEDLAEHRDELEWLYDNLSDDISREYLFYCLRGRMTGRDFPFAKSDWSDPEYFINGFIEWNDNECIVDCGAYNGDTVEEFIRKTQDKNINYKMYAIEPDSKNYEKLCEKYADKNEIVCVNKATYNKKEIVSFSLDGGEMSAISEGAGIKIQADTIDNILGSDKATFIKMDVEGSELQALMGAHTQIEENKPRLAICIYHKLQDFWTIPQYIKSLRPDYKLYIKTHSTMPTELVLFCL